MSEHEPVVTITLTEYNRLVEASKRGKKDVDEYIEGLVGLFERKLVEGAPLRELTPAGVISCLRSLKQGMPALPLAAEIRPRV